MTNQAPVFTPADWHTTAPGVWEARAKPATPGGRPPFQAVAWFTLDPPAPPRWSWVLYQPDYDYENRLQHLQTDSAATLDEACRRADALARRWRDYPDMMATRWNLTRYREHTTVACDACHTTYTLGTVLLQGTCGCGSEHFDGYQLDELAEAIL